jgi:chromosome segregation ATPase
MDGQLVTNDNNIMQDQFNKFNQQIQQLKTELYDTIKDKDIFKIIQSQHEQKISQLTLLVTALYKQLKTISTSTNDDEHLYNIQDKQKQFDDSLQTIVNNMETIQTSFITTDNGINQINNNRIEQQQQQQKIQNGINQINNNRIEQQQKIQNGINQINNNRIEQQQQQQKIQNGINANLNELQQKMTTLQKQFEKTINQTMKSIQRETKVLKGKVDNLERDIHGINLPDTNKLNTLPFVEKFPPMDLVEIDWDKYHEQNQIH